MNIDNLVKDESRLENYKAKDIIFNDGDRADGKMYIITSGSVGVYKNYNQSGEVCVATLAQGEFFGEMSLFLNKGRMATILAEEDLTVFVIDRTSIFEVLRTQPEIMFSFAQTLCFRLDSTNTSAADSVIKYEQDIALLNCKTSELEMAAYLDPLTNIYNRRYFMDNAKLMINVASKMNQSAFIVMFDLDHFKRLNDTYGHQAGDYVLTTFADMVNESVRSNDIFARYGGEEFILLITFAHQKDVLKLVERIRQTVNSKPIEFQGSKIAVSTSAGITSVTAGDQLEEAISFADQALYRAKSLGRNRIIFYEPEMEMF